MSKKLLFLIYIALIFSFKNIPAYANSFQITVLLTTPNDNDNDGIADEDDLDDDNDGIPDLVECNGIDPLSDADNDGVPVYLDDDDHNNAVGDNNGMCEAAFDLDGDGIPNHFDRDSDGDGIYDTVESGRLSVPVGTDTILDGMLEGNVGTNGLMDDIETSPDSGIIAYTILDTDADGTPDFLDIDDDNDGILTMNEHPDDNNNHYPDDAWDTNNNGISDYIDVTANITLLPDTAIHIYPIPAKSVLHIDFNIDITDAVMKLYTQDGKMIQQEMLNDTQNLIKLPHTKGIYYLKILTDKGEMHKPIIVR